MGRDGAASHGRSSVVRRIRTSEMLLRSLTAWSSWKHPRGMSRRISSQWRHSISHPFNLSGSVVHHVVDVCERTCGHTMYVERVSLSSRTSLNNVHSKKNICTSNSSCESEWPDRETHWSRTLIIILSSAIFPIGRPFGTADKIVPSTDARITNSYTTRNNTSMCAAARAIYA